MTLKLKKGNIEFIKKYFKKNKLKFSILYIITILNNIIELIPIYYLGKIINYVIIKDFASIIHTIFILIMLFVINSIFSIIETYLTELLNNEIVVSIKNDIYDKAMRINLLDFNLLTSGHIISLIEGDSYKVSNFIVVQVIDSFVSLVTCIVSLFFLVKLSLELTGIAAVSFPMSFLGYFVCGKKIKINTTNLRKKSDLQYSFLNKSLDGLKEVKAYVMEKRMSDKFFEYNKNIKEINIKISILQIIAGMLNKCISSLSDWLIIGYGTWLIINEKFTIGSYVAFNGYIGKFFGAASNLLNFSLIYQNFIVSFDRINNFLNLKNETLQFGLENFETNGDINFKNVSFKYSNKEEYILFDLCLKFKKNTISAVVGFNGCGKSTLLYLLERFYLIEKGEITVNDVNINEINLEHLRNSIGVVQQRPILIEDTLRENLVNGRDVSQSIIDLVCEEVGLKDFVNSLEKGYDSKIDNISGGELLKIAIARVLIKNPSILLLDEITSDLDGKSEQKIISLLNRLSENKTIILISHRLTSIINIPNIYVLNKGNVIGQGSHEQLIESCSLYKTLVSSQGKIRGDAYDVC